MKKNLIKTIKFSLLERADLIRFNDDRINKSIKTLSPKLKTAIKETYNRIIAWHKLQKKKDIYLKDKFGNKFRYINKPLKSAAIYCPGNLPSTALMN